MLAQIDLALTRTTLRELSPQIFAALLAVTALGLLARFGMWLIVFHNHVASGFLTAAATDLAVNFANLLLPGGLSGPVAMPPIVRELTGASWAMSIGLTGLHLGYYSLLYGIAVITGVLLIGLGTVDPRLLVLFLLAAGIYLAVGTTLIWMMTGRPMSIGSYLDWIPSGSAFGETVLKTLRKRLRQFVSTADDMSLSPRNIAVFTGFWMIAVLIAPALRFWLFLSLFSSETVTLALPVFIVLAYSVTILPISPGGIGVVEAVTVLVFGGLGIGFETAAIVVFLDRLLGVYGPALLGWVPFMTLYRSADA